jgi:hypothetical protein
MPGDNFCLLNLQVASLVQVSQQAESEFHGLREMIIKGSRRSCLQSTHISPSMSSKTRASNWRQTIWGFHAGSRRPARTLS